MTSIFLSYARSDDEAFVRRLYGDLTSAGFDVWYDRVSMPSRQLTFHQEIRDAIAARDRLLLVVGPGVLTSDYVTQEWRFAYFEAGKCVNPIVRLNDRNSDGATHISPGIDGYELIPEDLKLLHAEDFRDDADYDAHLANLIRQLSEAIPPVGKLVAVPELPASFLAQPDRIKALRDLLLVDLQKPVVVSGAAARVGLQGMGGIGKTVLASALAHRPEVRRAFPDGIFWITLGQKPQLAEQQRWLARELGDEALFPDERSGKECLRNLLTGRKALLVLDDVWQREDAEAFNVIGAMGRILLTTRDAGLVTELASKETHYRVELPTEAEAEGIFSAAARPKPEEPPIGITHEEVRQIVAQCGRLPLALALCGGMVQKRVTPQAVLEALRRHALRKISTRHPEAEAHRNLWVAMEASLEVLPAEEQMRFVELAVFPLDRGAPQAAVDTLWNHTGGLEPLESQILLAELAERSLVQLTPAAGDDEQPTVRMTLHDLLHNFATGMAEKQFGNMAALHQRLLDSYKTRCPAGWEDGPNDGYFYQNISWHVLEGGRQRELEALIDGPFLNRKAATLDDTSAFLDARGLAHSIADKKEIPQSLLLGVAKKCCDIYALIKRAGAYHSLPNQIRASRIQDALDLIDAEIDPTRKGILSLATSVLLESTDNHPAREALLSASQQLLNVKQGTNMQSAIIGALLSDRTMDVAQQDRPVNPPSTYKRFNIGGKYITFRTDKHSRELPIREQDRVPTSIFFAAFLASTPFEATGVALWMAGGLFLCALATWWPRWTHFDWLGFCWLGLASVPFLLMPLIASANSAYLLRNWATLARLTQLGLRNLSQCTESQRRRRLARVLRLQDMLSDALDGGSLYAPGQEGFAAVVSAELKRAGSPEQARKRTRWYLSLSDSSTTLAMLCRAIESLPPTTQHVLLLDIARDLSCDRDVLGYCLRLSVQLAVATDDLRTLIEVLRVVCPLLPGDTLATLLRPIPRQTLATMLLNEINDAPDKRRGWGPRLQDAVDIVALTYKLPLILRRQIRHLSSPIHPLDAVFQSLFLSSIVILILPGIAVALVASVFALLMPLLFLLFAITVSPPREEFQSKRGCTKRVGLLGFDWLEWPLTDDRRMPDVLAANILLKHHDLTDDVLAFPTAVLSRVLRRLVKRSFITESAAILIALRDRRLLNQIAKYVEGRSRRVPIHTVDESMQRAENVRIMPISSAMQKIATSVLLALGSSLLLFELVTVLLAGKFIPTRGMCVDIVAFTIGFSYIRHSRSSLLVGVLFLAVLIGVGCGLPIMLLHPISANTATIILMIPALYSISNVIVPEAIFHWRCCHLLYPTRPEVWTSRAYTVCTFIMVLAVLAAFICLLASAYRDYSGLIMRWVSRAQ
jgi:hypothetical protein